MNKRDLRTQGPEEEKKHNKGTRRAQMKKGGKQQRQERDTHRRNLENERSLHVVRIEFVANTSLLDSYYCA